MVYECDQCAAPLPPGVRVCPKCGDAFDETVPADAEVPTRGFTAKPVPAPVSIISPPIVSTLPTLKSPQIGPLREMSKEAQDGFQEFTGPELIARGKAENKSGKGLFQALFLIGAVAFVAWMTHIHADPDASSTPTSASTPQNALDSAVADLGGVGTLQGAPLKAGGQNTIVVLGQTKADFDNFSQANEASDSVGVNQLVASGRIFSVPAGQVQAKKIDSDWTGGVEVRIMSGQYQGQAAWTAVECLQK